MPMLARTKMLTIFADKSVRAIQLVLVPTDANARVQKSAIRARHGAEVPAGVLADGCRHFWRAVIHEEVCAAAASPHGASQPAQPAHSNTSGSCSAAIFNRKSRR